MTEDPVERRRRVEEGARQLLQGARIAELREACGVEMRPEVKREVDKIMEAAERHRVAELKKVLGLLCGANSMHTKLSHEIEEMRRQMEEEMRREAKTFNQFVRLNNRAHELATMLWAAIKTIHDRDTRIGVMNEVRAGFDRLEASDNATKAKR